ncbi:MAG TPA: dynamin family protein [Bryobacteraceae bacterium]|jgi:GTP-binding protein EngB required for normal cell division
METTTVGAAIDLLPGYTDTKLKLASIAEILLTLARERKDEERTHTTQRLLADLAEDAFRLAVVGKYNRGKSSLMNAMLGHEWLPTGILPLTSVITTVRYGTKQRALIRTEGSSLAHEISLEDLPQYVAEEHNPGNRKRVDFAEIQLPSDLLRYGFLFIDTPGLGSGITANTEATRRFLPEIDAAIVVLSFESPLDQADIDLLASLRRLRRKLFVVLNKADLVPRNERDRVTSFVRESLIERLPETPPLFPLSARDGLAARVGASESRLEKSGLKQFEDQLVHFLTTQKSELFVQRVMERTRNLLEQEQLESHLSEQLTADRHKAEELISIQRQEKSLLTKVGEAFARFRQQLPGLFYTLLDGDLRLWCAERKDEFLKATTENGPPMPQSPNESIRPRIAAATRQLRESEKDELAELARSFNDLLCRGNRLLGRDGSDLPVDEFDLLKGIAARDIDIPRLPSFQWTQPEWSRAIPSSWLRKRATTHVEKEFPFAVDSYCDAVRTSLENACLQWLERARREAESVIRAYTGRLEALRSWSDIVETNSILRDLSQRLEEIVHSSTGLPSARNVGYSGTAIDGATELCVVCRKASDAAFHFLSRFQYELTKDPTLQEEIGRNGGLCPFHTWMYESIGSPQGIAQGYAAVLDKLAGRLEQLTEGEANLRIFEDLIELLPRSEHCRICQVATSAESWALDEIAQAELVDGRQPNLCFLHLVALIPHVKRSETARHWIQREAVQFRRLAQDMRQFALKHNALRHYLSTEGERDSYLYGLMQLVGARQLSFVRKVKDLL